MSQLASEVDSAKYWLSWLRWGANAATFLIAVGVAGEVFVTWSSAPFQETIEEARRVELSQLERDTAGANARAATADAAAAEANRVAREAQLAQEQLRADNLRLEALIQPRRLSEEQRKRIGAQLEDFAGVRVGFILCSSTIEVSRFARDVQIVLRYARWDVLPGFAVRYENLCAAINANAGGATRESFAARHLLEVLGKEGIAVPPIPFPIAREGNFFFVPPASEEILRAPLLVSVGEKVS